MNLLPLISLTTPTTQRQQQRMMEMLLRMEERFDQLETQGIIPPTERQGATAVPPPSATNLGTVKAFGHAQNASRDLAASELERKASL